MAKVTKNYPRPQVLKLLSSYEMLPCWLRPLEDTLDIVDRFIEPAGVVQGEVRLEFSSE